MTTCNSCGQDNPDGFQFCGACGASLEPAAPSDVVRKTVTLVFSDIAGSTAMGEGRDPEAIRGAMDHYFAEMRRIVERHGGIVEKFVGDAVMAAFGIPIVHEDDALRAVRTAAEMRDRLVTLNDELERDWGVRLNARIGVNTGEVVAGDPSDRQTFATGDTVNTAARLEQAAPPNEILLGERTLKLVRTWVDVQPVAPLELKGKAEAVSAYRLIRTLAQRRDRGIRGPMVGRETEMRFLLDALSDAVRDSTARLVTVVASPGLGKSRLVEELEIDVDSRAKVFRAGCLAYGEGITFWPIVQVIKRAAGIGIDDAGEQIRRRLSALVSAHPHKDAVLQQLEALLGMHDSAGTLEGAFAAVRWLVETFAAAEPLILVIEDIHWAEATLLDLLEHVASQAAGPILVICTARPELLERSPRWASDDTGRLIRLTPLDDTEVGRLIEATMAGLPIDVRRFIAGASDGNPLFSEELLGMMVDEGHIVHIGEAWSFQGSIDDIVVPPSVSALIASRIDALPGDTREVVECASVIGLEFDLDLLGALVDARLRARLPELLSELGIRLLVRTGSFGRTRTFHHDLVRDEAYARLSKRRRAALHESFADALERWAGPAASAYEEIEGYHLEQSYRYRVELRPAGDEEMALAIRAGLILGSAGRRALSARGDVRAAVGLLDRSSELLPPDHPERHRVLTVLGAAFREHGDYGRAARCLDEAVTRAHSAGDVSTEWRAIVERLEVHRILERRSYDEKAREQLTRWIPVLERAEDHAGLAKAWRLRTWLDWDQGAFDESGRSGEQGVREARLAGEEGEATEIAAGLTLGWFFGPMPSSQGIDRCAALREELRGNLRSEAFVSIYLGGLYALQGRALEAGREIDEGERIVSETSIGRWSSFGAWMRLFSSLVMGESVQEEDLPSLEEGDWGEDDLWSVALRSRATSAAGRFDEALATLESMPSEGDFQIQATALVARSEALLGLGRVAEALDAAEKAEALLVSTDALLDKGEAKLALARALREMGSPTDSQAKTVEAIELFDAKEVLPLAHRARALYESLR